MLNNLVSRNLVWLVSLVALGGRAAAQPAPATSPPPPAGSTTAPAAPAASTAEAPAPVASPDEEQDPFTFADFTWQSGNARTKDSFLGNKYFTGEFRLDDVFHYSFNHPKDDTIGGSTEAWRHGENQVTQLGIGGDLHVDRVQGRLMTQFGQLATTTPRNDASPGRGQWQLDNMYRYISEAYGGYHFGDPHRGVNLQAGIFLSYVGLWSYYNFDNWTYQPSYVSSNTPWFFSGVRLQWFPTDRLKIEPWLINGWQSYGRFNSWPGFGGQIRWSPTGDIILIFNQYALGTDVLGDPDRHRFHTDESIQYKWYENPRGPITRVATTLTLDAGCEAGGAVSCTGGNKPAQYFVGFMAYLRGWFGEQFAATVGGGAIKNPGRYLVLLPPINGATAFSGTPYFTENPGDPWTSWDTQLTFDYMPSQFFTLRAEFTYRHASVPYFSGPEGITPPGGNQNAPGSMVTDAMGNVTWRPDLVQNEPRFTLALEVKL
ncbi:MAG: porin [Deltaproteobacteria bacterium]|nr:MAG: porin [Deltaproteobacteria bacterium]TMQ09753.1 MAG: porin [Deltaproteobacteria bacterium]